MGKIKIVCPECGMKLQFAEVPNYQNKLVECIRCHFKANVSTYLAGGLGKGGQGEDCAATELVFPPPSSVAIGQIRVLGTNEIQFLKPGSQVIGRRAETGTADIKISNDMTMSRRHVQIDVVPKGNGGYEHRLVEIGSLNIIKLNKRPIQRGDILVLKFGDVITLGKTDIVLESNTSCETRIN